MQIKQYDGSIIVYESNKETLKEVVEEAVANKINLRYSDLRVANLSYSNLSYSDLGGAKLRVADLRYSNLGYSDLSYSNLSYSDLRGAKLYGDSHDFAAEILGRAAGEDLKRLTLAGLPLVTRDWRKGEYRAHLAEIPKRLLAWAIAALTAEESWGFGWLREDK